MWTGVPPRRGTRPHAEDVGLVSHPGSTLSSFPPCVWLGSGDVDSHFKHKLASAITTFSPWAALRLEPAPKSQGVDKLHNKYIPR